MIILGALIGLTNIYSVGCLVSIPYALKAIKELKKNYDKSDAVVPAMAATVNYSRVTSLFLAVSMMVPQFQQGLVAHI
jgi:1,4-dihydroxy-2-naphthoate octaprenyltransferase